MAESLLVLFGSPDDERAIIGTLLVARGLDDLDTCAQFARAYADAMECNWMTSHEGREAIPPAYTEWIGRQIPWA